MTMVSIPLQTAPRAHERKLRLLVGGIGIAIVMLAALVGALAGHAG